MRFELAERLLAALAAQGTEPAEAGAPAEPDFRVYIWMAYGSVIFLLLLFSLWSVSQLKGAERKLYRLQERLEVSGKASPGKTG